MRVSRGTVRLFTYVGPEAARAFADVGPIKILPGIPDDRVPMSPFLGVFKMNSSTTKIGDCCGRRNGFAGSKSGFVKSIDLARESWRPQNAGLSWKSAKGRHQL
jgi:hypothetical protein